MSKRAKQILNSYLTRGSRDLKRFYKRENEDVTRAYRTAVHLALLDDGDDFNVISCNSRILTAGCITHHNDSDYMLYIRVLTDESEISTLEFEISPR